MFCGKFSKIHLAKKGNHFIQEILLRKNINEPPIRKNQSFKKILTFLYFFNTSLLLLIFLQITDPFIGFYSINGCGTFIFYRQLAIKKQEKTLKISTVIFLF